MTVVKNPAQAKLLGLPVGSPVPIEVPPGVNPEAIVKTFQSSKGSLSNNDLSLAITFRPGGPNDYKQGPGHAVFDAYGNFAFGAAGTAGGFSAAHLQGGANAVKLGHNDPVNTMDIQSGIRAISRGGTLSTEPHP
jgi:hypothetical protein